MPSKILVEQIAHTNETSAIDIDSSGNMVLQKDLKFNATAAIKNSAGNAILQESGGNVTLSNVRLPASGGISDSSGNNILTESGGVVSAGPSLALGTTSNPLTKNIVMGSGYGLDFSAAAGSAAGSSSAVLDDYEEGTWTPTELSGQATFSSASGTYTKIGNTVNVYFDYYTSNTGTPEFGGLPFTSTSSMGIGLIRENENTGIAWLVRVNQNSTQVLVRRYDNSSTSSSGDRYLGSVTYEAS